MKQVHSIAALALFVGMVLSLGSSPVLAKTYKLENGNITFEAPKGFRPMSEAVIKIKYPRGRPPKYVVSNASTQTSIAYDLKSYDLPQHKLEEAKLGFTRVLPRIIPGLVWVRQEIIQLAGQKWVVLEMTSSAIDTDIHNIMLLTGYRDKMLVFNFNSTKKEFPKYEAALRKSIASIKIK